MIFGFALALLLVACFGLRGVLSFMACVAWGVAVGLLLLFGLLMFGGRSDAASCRWQLMDHSNETGQCFSNQADCQRAAWRAGSGYWCRGR